MSLYTAFSEATHHTKKYDSYFYAYERLLEPYRNKQITLVETGVFDGGSLEMWRAYLGAKAKVIGVDLNPAVAHLRSLGFGIHIGDQTDPQTWNKLFGETGKINVFIDDGGHTIDQQLATFSYVVDHIADGGIYICEDTHTSYMPEFGCPSPISFVNLAKNLIDGINFRSPRINCSSFDARIASIEFFESMVAIKIDRRLAASKSSEVSNGIEPQPRSQDYRHKSTFAISATGASKLFRY